MNQEKHYYQKTNKIALIIVWLVVVLGELPDVIFVKNALGGALIVWGLDIIVFLPATIIYFKNQNSKLIRYFISCGAVLGVYCILYAQKGSLEDLYWIPVCLVASSVFFDRYVSIAATIISITTAIFLFYVNKPLFFPVLSLSQFAAFCICLLVIGVILVIQGDYGKRLITSEKRQAANMSNVYDKLKDALDHIENTANILDQSINGIKNEAQNIKEETGLMNTSIQHFSSEVEQTAKLAAESNSALVTIKDLITKTTVHTEGMISSSNSAFSIANEGKTVVSDLVSQMAIVGDSVKAAGEIVALLSVQSKKITDIAAFINDITRKTNLLALNASIEASRAGEVGEGFMVVADEMKSFAEQTAGALSGITQILRDLTEKIDQVKIQIHDGDQAIGAGIEKTNQVYEYLLNILNKTGIIKADVESFIKDTKVLSKESSVAFSNLSDIVAFSANSVATMEEISAGSIYLNEHISNIEEELAVELVELADKLKESVTNRV